MNTQRRNLLIGGGVVAIAVVAFLVFQFFSGDTPDEASLEDAVAVAAADQAGESDDGAEALDESDSEAASPDPASPDPASPDPVAPEADAVEDESAEDAAAPGADGTWTVDTGVGEFSYEDATSTFVGFRIGEELANIGQTEAVGRTPAVSGSIEIEGSTLVSAEIVADFTQITTDTSRRDGAVQRALETADFPNATFTLTAPADFGAVPAAGEALSVTAVGDLTVHGVTLPVEFPLEAQVVGDLVVVVGQIEVVLADFGVAVPSAPVVLQADDFATVEVQLFFSR
jgi:polyisoprenoid-binding protein YceI